MEQTHQTPYTNLTRLTTSPLFKKAKKQQALPYGMFSPHEIYKSDIDKTKRSIDKSITTP